MEVITAIVLFPNPGGCLRISDHSVKIDNPVEGPTVPDPFVHGPSHLPFIGVVKSLQWLFEDQPDSSVRWAVDIHIALACATLCSRIGKSVLLAV